MKHLLYSEVLSFALTLIRILDVFVKCQILILLSTGCRPMIWWATFSLWMGNLKEFLQSNFFRFGKEDSLQKRQHFQFFWCYRINQNLQKCGNWWRYRMDNHSQHTALLFLYGWNKCFLIDFNLCKLRQSSQTYFFSDILQFPMCSQFLTLIKIINHKLNFHTSERILPL